MYDPMTILKADHREARKLLHQLADSDEGSEREDTADQLATALTLHMDLEERLVYPLVRQHIGREDEEEAEVEHRLARDGLSKMLSMTEVPGFGAAVEMLLGGIEHHVKEEESELLPELKQAMERKDWLALGGRDRGGEGRRGDAGEGGAIDAALLQAQEGDGEELRWPIARSNPPAPPATARRARRGAR